MLQFVLLNLGNSTEPLTQMAIAFCVMIILIGIVSLYVAWADGELNVLDQGRLFFLGILFPGLILISLLFVKNSELLGFEEKAAANNQTFQEWMTYDALSDSQKEQVINQEELKLKKVCDCKLNKQLANSYLLKRAAPIQNGNLETEYSKLIQQRFSLKPAYQVKKTVTVKTDTIKAYLP